MSSRFAPEGESFRARAKTRLEEVRRHWDYGDIQIPLILSAVVAGGGTAGVAVAHFMEGRSDPLDLAVGAVMGALSTVLALGMVGVGATLFHGRS